MLNLLAQSHPVGAEEVPGKSVFDVITSIFSRGDALTQPHEMVAALKDMSIVSATIFLIVGLMCLFNGYRYYRVATVLLALAIGAFVGYSLGERIGAQWIVAGCTGALLATICFPLMKYAVAALGGLTGAYTGANAWSCISLLTVPAGTEDNVSNHYWIGAVVGLILFGILAFVLFKLSVIMVTSIGGATVMVIGVLALLLQVPMFNDDIVSSLTAHQSVIPMLVVVPAIIGLILQESYGGELGDANAKPS